MPPEYQIGWEFRNHLYVTVFMRRCTKHGVKIRGYGGAGLDSPPTEPLTKLLWTGSGTGPVIDLTPYGAGHVQDLELSHLVIDGDNTAKIGLRLNRVQQSRFIDLRVEKIAPGPGENDGVGILLCSDVGGKNVEFNYFESCTTRAPRALVLDGTETAGGANSNMNMFVNLRAHYRGTHTSDVGIWLKHAGDNSFSRVSIFNDNDDHQTREGHGVVVEHPYAAIGNYFYHLIPCRGVYVKDSTQPLPYEGRMMIYSHSIGGDEPFPQTDDPTVPPEKHVFWADDYGEMHGMPNLTVGTAYMAKGKVSVTANSAVVTGTQPQEPGDPNATRFDLDVKVGDRVTVVSGDEEIATRTVVSVADYWHLTVDASFPASASNATMRVITGRLSATGPADFASLKIGVTEVITSDRVLQNVAFSPASLQIGGTEVISDQLELHNVHADAGIINTGTIDAARLPVAGDTAAGIVSTGAQTFAGSKTFNDYIHVEAVNPTGGAGLTVGADSQGNRAGILCGSIACGYGSPPSGVGDISATGDIALATAGKHFASQTGTTGGYYVGATQVIDGSCVLKNVTFDAGLNVARLNQAQTWSGQQAFSQVIVANGGVDAGSQGIIAGSFAIGSSTIIDASKNVSTTGYGNFASLYIGDAQVITASMVLQNVTLPAHNHSGTNITSGVIGAGYLPEAGASAAGIVSIGAQTFAGAKTFSAQITANAGITAPGQGISAGSFAIGATTVIDANKNVSTTGIGNFGSIEVDSGTVVTSLRQMIHRYVASASFPTLAPNEIAVWHKQSGGGGIWLVWTDGTSNYGVQMTQNP
jgi:hypothetical protein